MTAEEPVVFDCAGAPLIGLVHRPAPGGTESIARRGVLIVVGGPQYRAGSHRQFLLMARALAGRGIAAMRFDYRGLGDSGGDFPGFEGIDDDIRAATDAFLKAVPELEEIVLWGLCDAASAILFYAHSDPRIAGAVILNPWVRSESGYARTQLRHYYLARLASREFWAKLVTGRLGIVDSLRGFFGTVRTASGQGAAAEAQRSRSEANPLAARMGEGLRRFARPTLLIMSGNDLTAREFDAAAAASPLWRDLIAKRELERRDFPGADHTFSRRAWRDQVADWTADWIAGL